MSKEKRILVMDKDAQLMDTVKMLLESVKYQVFCATEAAEGIALARETRPDLIVMDSSFVGPPGPSGVEISRQLSEEPQLKDTPVIILCSSEERPDEGNLLVQALLEKPFRPAVLLSEIERSLALRALAQDKGSGTILIVDDDPDFVEITTRILRTHGYDVLQATSGAEGLRIMRQQKPDVVLLDIMMTTVLDGLSASEEMRSDPELRDIPVIMISSIADTEYAAVFPTDGYLPMDEWISKPVRPEELLKKVRRHLP